MEMTAKEPHRDKAIEMLEQIKQAQKDYKPVRVDDKITLMMHPDKDPAEAIRRYKERKPPIFVL